MLSEISQAENDNYHMVSLIYGIAGRSVGEGREEKAGVNRRGNEPRETVDSGKQTGGLRGEGGGAMG